MRVLSDEEHARTIREIHQSYKEEARKMTRLSNEECQKIAAEVHQAYEDAVRQVAKDSELLNRLSHERALAKIEQEKQDKKVINEMRGSFFKRLFRFL